MGKMIAQEIFVAFATNSIIIGNALRANTGTISGNSESISRIIFIAMLTEAKMFVQTTFTN